jgi:hypothetical protein
MEVTPDPPLSTSAAEEANYGADDPIKQEFLRVLENARPLVFTPPGVETWDPVEVIRLLTIEGQTDAQAILDEMAAASQQELDAAWQRWDTFGQEEFEEQVEAEATPEPTE